MLVSQHPVTGEYGGGEKQITETLQAVSSTKLPAIVLWPNADAGSEDVSRGIRKYRERNADAPFHYVKNLPPEIYLPLMARTRASSATRRAPSVKGLHRHAVGQHRLAPDGPPARRQRRRRRLQPRGHRRRYRRSLEARAVPDESDLRRRPRGTAHRASAGDRERSVLDKHITY